MAFAPSIFANSFITWSGLLELNALRTDPAQAKICGIRPVDTQHVPSRCPQNSYIPALRTPTPISESFRLFISVAFH